jgi:hypothetical protein
LFLRFFWLCWFCEFFLFNVFHFCEEKQAKWNSNG